MTTRRHFMRSVFAATATIPALKNDGVTRILRTVRAAGTGDPTAVAEDEEFWREIRRAFDIDHGLINLNNGGGGAGPHGRPEAVPRDSTPPQHTAPRPTWGSSET